MIAVALNIVEIILAFLLGFSVLYVLFFSTAGLKNSQTKPTQATSRRSFLIIIPAYREDKVINECLASVYAQNYSHSQMEISIVAQQMDGSSIQTTPSVKTNILKLDEAAAGKAGALNHALKKSSPKEAVLILDADNILSNNFLNHINYYFMQGYSCVQGQRTAKNRNNSLAILDAASEGINNHIFRRGHRNAGLSSALVGSAMAFDYKVFRRIMPSIKTMMGFDKEMEHELLKNKHKIAYAEQAIAYDEKIHRQKDFVSQRRRWLSAQFTYRNIYFREGIKELMSENNIDFFNKTLQMLMLPRSILMGLLSLLFLTYLLLPENTAEFLLFSASFWGLSLLIFVLSLLIALPKKMLDRRLLKAIVYLPVGIFLMAKSMISYRKKQYDYRTPHGNI
jgi:cellulose synthase/poly-beta-1,6-N-acetylglucosamine synthase-like glycosyltransferase